jgi:hypothetical protein
MKCECQFCGEEFESKTERTICDECAEAIDDCGLSLELVNSICDALSVIPQDIMELDAGNGRYQIDGVEYLLLSKYDANDKAKETIADEVWSFNAEFLAEETGLPEIMFQAVEDNGRCESNNDVFMQCIEQTCGINEFATDAIDADGLGHFLDTYDGEGMELDLIGDIYYLFRQD